MRGGGAPQVHFLCFTAPPPGAILPATQEVRYGC
jgi:hypothetical protein